MEDLNFDLVVFSPYRSLTALLRDSAVGETVGLCAWSVLNDSYRTDVNLLYPPHLVALACIQLASVHLLQQESEPLLVEEATEAISDVPMQSLLQRLSKWMGTLDVDLNQVGTSVSISNDCEF